MARKKSRSLYWVSSEKLVTAAGTFLPVRISSLVLDAVTGFDLFTRPAEGAPPVLYRERRLPFTAADRRRLQDSGILDLYVPESDEAKIARGLLDDWDVASTTLDDSSSAAVNRKVREHFDAQAQALDAVRRVQVELELGEFETAVESLRSARAQRLRGTTIEQIESL